MAGRWTVAVVVALLAAMGACRAEERMQATLGRPALVTAKPAAALGAAPRVVVTVVAFTPPPDRKPVEIVVTASSAGGMPHELGRVAVLPYAAFTVADTARHKTFAFPLPADLRARAVDLSIALVPVRGGGQGASLEVGSVMVR